MFIYYVCIYIHTYIHICICIYLYTYTCKYIYIFVYMYILLWYKSATSHRGAPLLMKPPIYEYIYVYTCLYIYTYIHLYIYVMHMYVSIHTCIYTHTYIYIYICIYVCVTSQSDLDSRACLRKRKRDTSNIYERVYEWVMSRIWMSESCHRYKCVAPWL